jgi:hypothetical protein
MAEKVEQIAFHLAQASAPTPAQMLRKNPFL